MLLFVVALGLSSASCSSCVRGGSGKDDLALLPRDATGLAGLNFKRMQNTALWRKLLDVRDQSAETRKAYDEFVAQTGLDPFKQVDSATLALGDHEFGAVLRGAFDEQKLVAYAGAQIKKQGHEMETMEHGGKKQYAMAEGSQMYTVFQDPRTILLGGRAWSRTMIDLSSGKVAVDQSAQKNDALMTLVKKAQTSEAIWFAALIPESLRDQIRGKIEAAKTMKAVYGSIDFVTGLSLLGTIELGGPEDAKALVDKVAEQLGELKKNPQVMMIGLSTMIDTIKPSAEASNFKLAIRLNQAQVDQLVEQVRGMLKNLQAGGASLRDQAPTLIP